MQTGDQIIQVLEYLAEKMGVTIDWGQQNVLPYVQQLCEKYIRYELATSVMWEVIGLMLVASSIGWVRAIRFCAKKFCEENGCGEEIWLYAEILCIVMLVACVLTGIAIIPNQADDIMRCIFCPEAQIYLYINSLM